MSNPQAVARNFPTDNRLVQVSQAFFAEAAALLQALLNPGQIIGEVEQMHALRRRADQVEALDPASAARLRRQASLLGLSR